MTESDYSKIPEEYYVKGFMFPCSPSHLNRPICLSASEVDEMPDGSGNRDMIFIRCKRCDRMMTYRAGTDDHLDGKWKCECCGRSVREVTPYQILEQMNLEFEEEFLLQDEMEIAE